MRLNAEPALTVGQQSNASPNPEKMRHHRKDVKEDMETYLNHAMFGLLYKVCRLENNQELFTTVYTMRLFFLVNAGAPNIAFEPITRTNARQIVETRLRSLRRLGQLQEYDQLQTIYQQTF